MFIVKFKDVASEVIQTVNFQYWNPVLNNNAQCKKEKKVENVTVCDLGVERRLLGGGFLAVVKKSHETGPSAVFSTFDVEQSTKIH